MNRYRIECKRVDVDQKCVKIDNSTPQGSVMSPVLINIMLNDILVILE